MGTIKKFMLLCLIVLCTLEVTLTAPTMDYVVAVDPRNNQPYLPILRYASNFFRNIFDYTHLLPFGSTSSTPNALNNPPTANLFNTPYQPPVGQGFQPYVESAGNTGAQAVSSASHLIGNGLSSVGTVASDTAHALLNTIPMDIAKGAMQKVSSLPTMVHLPDETHMSLPSQPSSLGQAGLPLPTPQVQTSSAQSASNLSPNLPLVANAAQSAATAAAAAPNPALPQPPLAAPVAAASAAVEAPRPPVVPPLSR